MGGGGGARGGEVGGGKGWMVSLAARGSFSLKDVQGWGLGEG